MESNQSFDKRAVSIGKMMYTAIKKSFPAYVLDGVANIIGLTDEIGTDRRRALSRVFAAIIGYDLNVDGRFLHNIARRRSIWNRKLPYNLSEEDLAVIRYVIQIINQRPSMNEYNSNVRKVKELLFGYNSESLSNLEYYLTMAAVIETDKHSDRSTATRVISFIETTINTEEGFTRAVTNIETFLAFVYLSGSAGVKRLFVKDEVTFKFDDSGEYPTRLVCNIDDAEDSNTAFNISSSMYGILDDYCNISAEAFRNGIIKSIGLLKDVPADELNNVQFSDLIILKLLSGKSGIEASGFTSKVEKSLSDCYGISRNQSEALLELELNEFKGLLPTVFHADNMSLTELAVSMAIVKSYYKHKDKLDSLCSSKSGNSNEMFETVSYGCSNIKELGFTKVAENTWTRDNITYDATTRLMWCESDKYVHVTLAEDNYLDEAVEDVLLPIPTISIYTDELAHKVAEISGSLGFEQGDYCLFSRDYNDLDKSVCLDIEELEMSRGFSSGAISVKKVMFEPSVILNLNANILNKLIELRLSTK